ncbi:MAG TPA: hypothetical protein VF896_06385 [Anaerolineales bacterium]
MNTSSKLLTNYLAHWISPFQFGQLLLLETDGRERENLIELITQWTLRGSFFLIVAGDWFVDHDEVRYSVFRYTNDFDKILDRLRLVRARTCFQFLDLLMEADKENKSVLILDPLHHFYNADVELSIRDRILAQCCQFTKRLSLSNYVAVLVPKLDTEDHRRFFSILAAIADEIIPVEEASEMEVSQDSLF